mgnify:CR=1 FL=1
MKLQLELHLTLILILQNWRLKMDSDKFKSVAINIKTYRLLEELSQKKFELPISMSKTVEFFIQKGHEEFKSDANRKAK